MLSTSVADMSFFKSQFANLSSKQDLILFYIASKANLFSLDYIVFVHELAQPPKFKTIGRALFF